jgi:putative ATPase
MCLAWASDVSGPADDHDLFAEENAYRPLADRLRPRTLDEVVGQSHLLGGGKSLRRALGSGRMHSMLFWGPPGTGKTTLARLVAVYCDARFLSVSAVLSGVKEIRQAVESAREHRGLTVLFVDEVHRFNKAQQDAFLPHIEDGTFIFVGATTENPSFELNNALLSRTRTYVLKPLDEQELASLLERALSDRERGLGALGLAIDEEARPLLLRAADGDARRLLTFVEILADLGQNGKITLADVEDVVSHGHRRFDNKGDIFYEQISALHKSVRGSDPDAALYWMCRMLDGGCDPVYLARRVTRMASEDIGNADPRALEITLNAWQTWERLGSPEGELAIAQAVVYLACAAKSNAVYTAFNAAMDDARKTGSMEVPAHLRNAPTRFMKALGYGKNYRYAHDEAGGFAAGETYFPDALSPRHYYHPVDRGLEIKIGEKLAYLRELSAKRV